MSMVLTPEKAIEIINALRKKLTPDELSAVKYFAIVRKPEEFYEILTSRWPTLLDSPALVILADDSWAAMPFKPSNEFMGPTDCRRINLCYAIQWSIGLIDLLRTCC